MIESDLVTHLKADAAITALVGNRISPLKAEQNVAKPYITYQVILDYSNQCLGGGVYANSTRFQIDCWSEKYSEVKAIKTAVINALIGFKSSNNITVMDDYEADTELYRQIIDFKLKD